MGNTHSNKDKHAKPPAPGGADLSLLLPSTPTRDSPQNSAFTFEKKTPQSKLVYQGSHDEQESYMKTVIEVSNSNLCNLAISLKDSRLTEPAQAQDPYA